MVSIRNRFCVLITHKTKSDNLTSVKCLYAIWYFGQKKLYQRPFLRRDIIQTKFLYPFRASVSNVGIPLGNQPKSTFSLNPVAGWGWGWGRALCID